MQDREIQDLSRLKERNLKKADCVIYDRLIPQELLDETKEGCEHIYVGKENHHHTMKQEQINELLAQKALQYDIVVQFKRWGSICLWKRWRRSPIFSRSWNLL